MKNKIQNLLYQMYYYGESVIIITISSIIAIGVSLMTNPQNNLPEWIVIVNWFAVGFASRMVGDFYTQILFHNK